MKYHFVLPVIATLLAAAAPEPTVEVATGDWSGLPDLQYRGSQHLSSKVMQRLWELATQRKCQIPGYASGRLDMRFPFAVQYGQDGKLSRLLVPALNCPEAEGILAGAVLNAIKTGDFARKGPSEDGWYRGDLFFVYEA